MRILFLSSWFPTPPINGAQVRINNLLRFLVLRHEVTLISFVHGLQPAELENELARWRRDCPRVVALPCPPRSTTRSILGYFARLPRHVVATYDNRILKAVMDEAARSKFDVIIASEVGPAAGMARYASKVTGSPKILDGLEIGTFMDAISHRNPARRRWRAYLTWFKLKDYLQMLLKGFDVCTVPSAVEKKYIEPLASTSTDLRVLPHGLDLHYLNPVSSCLIEPNTLVYNGSLTYAPNRDAVDFFSQQILPVLRAAVPDLKFRVLGDSNGIEKQYGKPMEGTEFRGLLRDIRPVVSSSWASVAPLRYGAGTRIKIIESMALGTPVVSTSKGAEGLEVSPNSNILIADNPTDFALRTLHLLRSEELRQQLSSAGRKLVQEKYDWISIGNEFNQLIESVVSRRREARQ